MIDDLISRQVAIDELKKISFLHRFECGEYLSEDTREIEIISSNKALKAIGALPSVQSTLYGYDIKHLELIAKILQKENLSPERVTEAFSDINRVIELFSKEFEESLTRTVEQ